MKMIIAVVNKEDSNMVSAELTQRGFLLTRLSTTGGFLMAGNITFLIGTEEERVDEAIGVLKTNCEKRKEVVPSTAAYGMAATAAFPLEVVVGGATIFVVDVERFEKV